MRFHAILALCGVLATASPVFAQSQSATERFQLTHNALNCESLYTAHKYALSLSTCNDAVKGFDRATVTQSNPWYAYYMKATMLQYAALDQSALGHHRASLRTAVNSHQLARYVYTTYHIDKDDYQAINTLIQHLQQMEAQEQRYINRGEGD